MDDLNKHKRDFLLSLLSEGDAMVCLDARESDVDVPKTHKNDPSLNLIFNLNFRRPLDIQEEGIFATLAFGGRPHKCVIPFHAVWAIYEPDLNKGQVWEESLPKDINLAEYALKKSKPKPGVPSASPPSPEKPKPRKPESKPKRDRSHLRIIK